MSEPNPEILAAAARAGASTEFLTVAAADHEAAGAGRNHAANVLHQATSGRDAEYWPDAIEERALRSGSFIHDLWHGDLAEALYHADIGNMKLLFHCFDHDVLLAELAEDRGSVESARKWLEPNIERYA